MSQLLFGTDGIRTLVGTSPLTIQELPKLGYAIAQWASENNRCTPSILLAHDTRSSCHFIKAALKSGLLLNNCKVFDALALPTPTTCILTRMNKAFNCGIIITASYNPSQYNGIKIIDAHGRKIDNEQQTHISELFNKTKLESVDHTRVGNDFRALNPCEPYIHTLSTYFNELFLQGKTIALDCAHGATSTLAPHIFRMFGAHVVAINASPDGRNINQNCGALFPKSLVEVVKAHKADAGFAFDGDGDRVIAVNRQGHIKDGDDMLALLTHHTLFKNTKSLIGTTFTNEGLNKYLAQHNKKLIRSDVGEQNVVTEMHNRKINLGGEPIGHILMPHYLDSSDGIYTALMVMDSIMQTSNWDMTTFQHYPQVLVNIPVRKRMELNRAPITDILTKSQKDYPSTRFVIRYSGTESLLRILVESEEKNQAEFLATKLANQLRTAFDAV
jgi:phosphoglucosamine mutase